MKCKVCYVLLHLLICLKIILLLTVSFRFEVDKKELTVNFLAMRLYDFIMSHDYKRMSIDVAHHGIMNLMIWSAEDALSLSTWVLALLCCVI